MAIEVQCPTCGAVLPAPDEFAGQKIRCADCEAIVDVPAGSSPAVAKAVPVPTINDERMHDEENDDRPARKPKQEWDDDPNRTPSGQKPNVLTGTAVGWLLLLGVLSCVGLALLGMALIPPKG